MDLHVLAYANLPQVPSQTLALPHGIELRARTIVGRSLELFTNVAMRKHVTDGTSKLSG